MTDPDGKTTSYGYDALDRLSSVTLPPSGAEAGGVVEQRYLRNSLLEEVLYPNGASSTYAYDAANRLLSIDHRQHAAPVASYVYSHDRNGNRLVQEETNGGAVESTTYGYDGADRLVSVRYPDRSVTYTLDGVGNRATETVTDPGGAPILSARTYTYDSRDRLIGRTDSVDPSSDVLWAYDANGNQIEKTAAGETTGYVYDVRDQLVEVTRGGSLLESYAYAWDGLRTRKSGPGGLFRYVYDQRSLLLETDLSGTTVSKIEWGSDRLLALDHATEGRQIYLVDVLGSPIALSKPDGTLRTRLQWDAWGNERKEVGESENRFGFTGYQRDEATGLYYAQARLYDPEVGRFLSEDPFEGEAMTPPSLHRYAYAHGRPTVFVDPTGRCVLEDWYCFGTFLWELSRGVVGSATGAAIGTLDAATLGAVSASQEGVDGFLGAEGGVLERAGLAAAKARTAQLGVVTLGFSNADDPIAHARELAGVEEIRRAGTLFGEAVAEADLEKGIQASGMLLSGAGRIAGLAASVVGPASRMLASRGGTSIRVPTLEPNSASRPLLRSAGQVGGSHRTSQSLAWDAKVNRFRDSQTGRFVGQAEAVKAIAPDNVMAPHPFAEGASHITTSGQLDRFPGSLTIGGPTGLFVSPAKQIDRLLARATSRRYIEIALGLEKGALSVGQLLRIDVENAISRRLRMPIGGNRYHRLHTGLTPANLNEAVIDSPLRADPRVRKIVVTELFEGP